MIHVTYEMLDDSARAETAFHSWQALLDACKQGYVPTIRGETRAQRILRHALRVEQCRVWPN